MKQDLTHVVVVSDRSGSMSACRDEAEAAINRFIEDQRKMEGECQVTLVEFDDVYDIVHNGVDVKDVGEYSLQPRGMTALYDAVGKAVHTVRANIKGAKKKKRPALVTVVISTDGLNNASKEYTKQGVADIIAKMTKKGWKFVFLGVEINAEQIAGELNIDASCAVQLDRNFMLEGLNLASSKLCCARSAVNSGCSAESVSMAYTDAEKDSLKT
jgi:Mg-chelatase subunit ChlD